MKVNISMSEDEQKKFISEMFTETISKAFRDLSDQLDLRIEHAKIVESQLQRIYGRLNILEDEVKRILEERVK
ncbi:MAG: hypothetical protein ACYDAO_04435 [Thermoplasmataceae archaeon]